MNIYSYILYALILTSVSCKDRNESSIANKEPNNFKFHFSDVSQQKAFSEKKYIDEWKISELQIHFRNAQITLDSIKGFQSSLELMSKKNMSYSEIARELNSEGKPYIRGRLIYETKSYSPHKTNTGKLLYHVISVIEGNSISSIWLMPGNAENATGIYTRIIGTGAWNGSYNLGASRAFDTN